MNPFRRILVATDFGPSSERAIALAVDLVERDGATLTLLHVFEPHTGDPETLVPLTNEPSADAPWERETRARLAALRGSAPITETVVRMGEPWKTIVDEAESRDVDLVVVGTHGRKSAKRWLLGSVAERVVRECKRPVLTAHADDHEAPAVEAPAVEAPHDSTVVKIDSARSPSGTQGQRYLANGVRAGMRLWERVPLGESPETERDYEVIGYVLGGEAELHVEGQRVHLEPGDSYVVPRHARHHYRILSPFTALEATSPPAVVHGRDEAVASGK